MAKLSAIASLAVPAGEYSIRINSVESGESSKGAKKLTFKGTIKGGEEDGKTVYISRSLQPQALFKLGGDLIAAGVSGDQDIDFEDGDELVAALQNMCGKTYVYKADQREYNGSTTNDFTLVRPLDDADQLSFEFNEAGV